MRTLLLQRIFFLFTDVMLMFLSFAFAYIVRLGIAYFMGFGTAMLTEFPFWDYLLLGVSVIPIWFFLLSWGGRYSLEEKSFFEHFRITSLASLGTAMIFVLGFFFKREIFFSRAIVLLIFCIGCTLLMFSLFFFSFLQRYQKNKSRMLIIGAGRSAENIIPKLIKNKSYHKPVAIIAPYGSRKKEICTVPVVGKLDALEQITKEYDIQEIFLCDAMEQSANILSFAEGKGIAFSISPEILETLGIYRDGITSEWISGVPRFTIRYSPLFGWGQVPKRFFDIVISGIALLFLSPYFLYHASSFTPFVFQKGSDNVFIHPLFCKNGKIFARKKALLYAVFTGKMSLVGPSALLQKEYEKSFSEEIRPQIKRRFLLKPSIFSPADHITDPEKKAEEEIRYIMHWSFWRDIKVLWNAVL